MTNAKSMSNIKSQTSRAKIIDLKAKIVLKFVIGISFDISHLTFGI